MGLDRKLFLLLKHAHTQTKGEERTPTCHQQQSRHHQGDSGLWLSAFGLFTSNNWHHGTEPLPPNVGPNN